MTSRVLKQIRERVRSREYVMTLHAEEEMNDDGLSIFDVESCILTGGIVRRGRDRDLSERKYVIAGKTLDGVDAAVVGKLSLTGKLVIITVYLT